MELLVKNVNKKIRNKVILSDVNLHLSSGKIYGFVGANGSGKTMLFRAVSGLMQLSSGEISLDGKVLHKDMKVLPNIGIIIENAGLYPELTGFENLKLLAKLNHKISEKEIRSAIERVGLDSYDKRSFRKYSLGMKQRIILAQAIMEKPDILLMDEPTNALDDQGVKDIRNIILEEKKRGALIMIASHNKDDIEILSDMVFTVSNGSVTEREAEHEV